MIIARDVRHLRPVCTPSSPGMAHIFARYRADHDAVSFFRNKFHAAGSETICAYRVRRVVYFDVQMGDCCCKIAIFALRKILAINRMAYILNIETSTEVCSVAIGCDGDIVFHREDYRGQTHATALGVFVDEALGYADSRGEKLDAVSVSRGPGSYTGLRIGVSMAKGICFGRDIPLISIPTLETLCVMPLLYHDLPDDALLCPMIDARRMEVYAAVYDRALNMKRGISADVIAGDSYREFLDAGPVYFFGNGAAKCKDTLVHANARFIDGITPLAKSMSLLSERKFMNGEFEDTAYFEPFYLKEFVASKPKKIL